MQSNKKASMRVPFQWIMAGILKYTTQNHVVQSTTFIPCKLFCIRVLTVNAHNPSKDNIRPRDTQFLAEL